jgi:hypothetical protein
MRVWHHILSQDIIFMSHFTYKTFNIHFLIQLGTQLALEISTISPSTESIYFYGYVRLNSHLNLKYQQSLPQMWVSSILFIDMLPLKWKFFHTLAPLLWHSTGYTVQPLLSRRFSIQEVGQTIIIYDKETTLIKNGNQNITFKNTYQNIVS